MCVVGHPMNDIIYGILLLKYPQTLGNQDKLFELGLV